MASGQTQSMTARMSRVEVKRRQEGSEGPAAIEVRGARAGPLRDVDLDLPLGVMACFAGPSGSGATTMALDVLFAESHRRYCAALSPFERQSVRAAPPAEVESVSGLPPAVLLSARRARPRARRGGTKPAEDRATVGALLQTTPGFAELFVRFGEVACPSCGGRCESFDVESAARRAVQQLSGGILVAAPIALAQGPSLASILQVLQESGFTRLYLDGRVVRLDELSPDDLAPTADRDSLFVVIDRVRSVDDGGQRLREAVRTARAVGRGRSLLIKQDTPVAIWLNQALTCSGCGSVYDDPHVDDLTADPRQGGLSPEHISLRGCALAAVVSMRIDEALGFCAGLLEDPVGGDGERALEYRAQVEAQRALLTAAAGASLGHVSLDRPLAQLSSGEYLRLMISNCANRGLAGILYVCETPVSGLDAEARSRTVSLLRQLSDRGNTVLLLDNDPLVHEEADAVVYFDRGEVRPSLSVESARAAEAADLSRGAGGEARYIHRLPEVVVVAEPVAPLTLMEVSLPLGRITCVTGISGAGKTSLLRDVIVPAFAPARGKGTSRAGRAARAGPSPIRRVLSIGDDGGKEEEGIVLEKLGLFGRVAGLFARTPVAQQRGYAADWFQLARPGGRCPSCEGRGRVRHDMDFLEDIDMPCTTCEGRRFRPEVLEITWRGQSMADVMAMSVGDAALYFDRSDALAGPLTTACSFGLRGCRLGQAAADLDGPAALRVQLCAIQARASEKDLILLDAPAAGAHATDVRLLVELLTHLAHKGATIVAADVHTEIVESAARVIEMGPGRGPAGGRVTTVIDA